MKRAGRLVFAYGLQNSVFLLRWGGLIGEKQFLELLTPITAVRVKLNGKERWMFLVHVKVREDFKPNRLWLLFNRKGNSVYVSPDQKEWSGLFFSKKSGTRMSAGYKIEILPFESKTVRH
jgi:hypothetical protein